MQKVFPGRELTAPASGPGPLLRFNEDHQATEEVKNKRIVISAAIERHPVPDINNGWSALPPAVRKITSLSSLCVEETTNGRSMVIPGCRI